MVHAANKPILQHVLEALVANGVTDIRLVVGYQRERVQAQFGDGSKFGCRITYAFQDALTGTAAALAAAPAPKGSFLVLGGDNLVDAAAIRAALDAQPPAIVVHRSDRPEKYGVVTLDGNRLAHIVEKPKEPKSSWVNTGIYHLTPDFHARAAALVQSGAPAGLPDVLQHALSSGATVHAVKSDALWSDAVYPWDLLRVNADALRVHARPHVQPGVHTEMPHLVAPDAQIGPGTTVGAGTCVGDNVVIGAQCVLENVVIYDDVQIGPGSILRNSVVGAGTRIGPRFTALTGPCDIRSADGWHHLEDFGAVIGEDCIVGGAVTLLPGTILGNAVRVAHAKTIHTNADDRARVM